MASFTFHTAEWQAAGLTGPVPVRHCIENGEMRFCQATICRDAEDDDRLDVIFWESFEDEV
jgi:hypothetical protein